MEEWAPRLRGDCFAEAFVDGREFNISVIATADGPRVLPIAEIHFIDYPEGQAEDRELQGEVGGGFDRVPEHAAELRFPRRGRGAPRGARPSQPSSRWDLFALRGYARVDFRVDPKGKPYILEINANPCISPDSGFIAAAQQGGSITTP